MRQAFSTKRADTRSALFFDRSTNALVGNPWTGIAWVYIMFVVLLVVFSLLAEFARTEQTSGVLVSIPESVRIGTPRNGRVADVFVKAGTEVIAGDVLVSLTPSQSVINGDVGASQLLEKVRTSKQEVLSRLQFVTKSTGIVQEELAQRIDTASARLEHLSASVKLHTQIIESLENQREAVTQMNRQGGASLTELQDREILLRNAQINAQSLIIAKLETEDELSSLKGQLAREPVQALMDLSSLRESLSTLEQREIELEGEKAFQIIAPVDGVVDSVYSSVGMHVEPGSTVLSIIPENSELLAELYVPSRAIVFVKSGQKIRLAYDAFPAQRYGMLDAEVIEVSRTILSPTEITRSIKPVEPSYLVKARLDEQFVKFGSETISLRPGLILSAEIILDKKPLAAWITQSVRSLVARL